MYENLQILLTNSSWKLIQRSHIYEIDGKPPLWLYWDNKNNRSKMPPHICLALRSLHCHNHERFSIRIVNSKSIHNYIPDVHAIFSYLIPAHRADYFRGRILEKYGGMYMDIDAIALQSLGQWFDFLTYHGYNIVGYSWLPDGDRIGIGTLGPVHANHPLFQQYTRDVHKKMDDKLHLTRQANRDLFRWAEIMREIIVPIFHGLVKRNETKFMMYDGPSTVGQLTARGLSLLSNTEDCNASQKLNLNVPFLIYHNSALRNFNGTDQQLLESQTLLGCLYRLSLKSCKSDVGTSITKKDPSCDDLQLLYTKDRN